MKVVVAFTSDVGNHSGGAKQLYRQVDILNENGIDACIAHPTRGLRLDWFKNTTRILCSEDIELGPDDFLAFGEQVVEIPRIRGADRCGKVLLVQNPYGVFMGFNRHLAIIRDVYGSAAGVLCQSKYTEDNVRYFFPAARVFGYRYSFDRPPFSYCGEKRKIVAYMPRKNAGGAEAVFSLMAMRRCPDDWQTARLEGMNEEQVAAVMRGSAMFVSFSQNEGFGMPPAEAMACGCAVVGFPGFAGDEYMRPGISWPVRDYDVLSMVMEIEKVMMTDLGGLVEVGRKASEFIRSEYSTAKEVAGIMSAWKQIARKSVEITDGAAARVKKEVAAYVPVYNEGPYLEALLKWLVRRVGAVFVCESEKSWCPTAEPGGKSKLVVDKVLAEVPEAAGVLRYMLVGESGAKEKEPLARESEQRNRTLDEIRKAGFPFVWMVEADEFYADADADRLWRWFFDRESSLRSVRCSWHTYWRSLKWRIEPPELFRPNIIFRSDCRFVHGRKMAEHDEAIGAEVPPEVCLIRHYSWARTPEDTKKKLSAWGHALQLRKGWFDEVFAAWRPGSKATNLHPIVPSQYVRVMRCDLPVPEALRGHPFESLEVIEDKDAVKEPESRPALEAKAFAAPARPRIKAVVMSHDEPESVDRLYAALAPVFDDVEVFDSGSDKGKVPCSVTRSFPNIYWTGLWNEVIRTCGNYDAVWVLGGDVKLECDAARYREAIESSLPFGLWSPAVNGRAKPFMQHEKYGGKPRTVRNIEGMAMAASRGFLEGLKALPDGNALGYGQDLWMCWRAREMGMRNVVDGRVSVLHPSGTGYDNAEAGRQMDETFSRLFGKDYRRTAFLFSDFFEDNVVGGAKEGGMAGKMTVVTVDNGWGMADFVRIVSKVEGVRALVVRKGVLANAECEGVESVPYDQSLATPLREADVALFTRVGDANRADYEALLKAGVPTVVHDAYAGKLVEHQKNGYLYIDERWAMQWLSTLRDHPEERERLEKLWGRDRSKVAAAPGTAPAGSPNAALEPEVFAKASPEPKGGCGRPRVSVITPTYRRDPKVVARCMGCMAMQTMADWEQVVCSDGEDEPSARKAVESFGDPRVRYRFTQGKKEGDFGNTVRLRMLTDEAKGDYVLFCDDDNIVMPSYLERMVAALDAHPEAGFAVCRVMHFGPLNEAEAGRPPKVLTGEPVKLYHVDPLQILVRRDIMLKVGWDTDVGYLSDGVTLEKLGKACGHVRVEEVLGVHV